MLNKLRGIFISGLFVCLGVTSFAQNNNTSSPFSLYGLGELHSYSTGRFAAMGGASLGSRHHIQVNSSNPASYTAIDSMSFNFEFGADGRFSEYKSATSKYSTNDVNFRYFSWGFPITRWAAAAMGIQPYADKGYEIYVQEDNASLGRIGHSYVGSGTISKAYFGAGFKIGKSLSIGTNIFYLFGTQNQNNSIYFLDDAQEYGYNEVERLRIRDFGYMLGFQYDLQLKNDDFLTIGATFEQKSNFTAFHYLNQEKVLQYGGSALTDSIYTTTNTKGSIQLPTNIGLGLSYAKLNKLEVNLDYYYSKWSAVNYDSPLSFFQTSFNKLTDRSRISLGVEYIPENASIRSYLSRIEYRAGVHLEKSYLKINNQQLNESGISFGIGLPVVRSRSTINLGVEFGRRGSIKQNLIRENYTKISLSLNLFDRWFIQRKYD
ncbi:MAG TPA: hypothetical protein VKA27_06745 [Sunxiuqinia sp.]|nr:hypothetical protein [Sunxiuqinia sp.]